MPVKTSVLLYVAPIAMLIALFAAGCGSDTEPAGVAVAVEQKTEAARETLAVGPGPDAIDLYVNRVSDQIALHWYSYLAGDYNVDGSVTGLDLFPLAANFNRATTEEAGLECIDGNEDGTLNGLDLFTISVNFQQRIDSYGIFQAAEETGPFSEDVITLDPMPYEGCGEYSVGAFDWGDGQGPWFAIKSFDSAAAEWSAIGAPVEVPLPPVEIWPATWGMSPVVHIDWDNTAHAEDTWVVYRGTEPGGELTQQTFEPVTTSSWSDETAEAGMTYYYAVSTLNQEVIESLNSPVAEIAVPGWEIITLDDTSGVGEDSRAVITSADVMYICYHDAPNHALRVGAYADGMWSSDQIDGGAGLTGEYCSIALDTDEYPHVSYHYSGDQLRVASLSESGWTLTDVDTEAGGSFTDIAFNGQGYPGVSHHDWGQSLRYSWSDGSSWQSTEILGDNAGSWGTALMYDQADHPVISYYHQNSLQVAWHDGSDWLITVVDDSVDYVGERSDIMLGPDMQPVISYFDRTNEDLKLARFNGLGWDIEAIDTESRSGMNSSITHDVEGNLYIAYRCINPLKVCWEEDGQWNIQSLPTGASGVDASLVLDSRERPLISFSTGVLMLARFH